MKNPKFVVFTYVWLVECILTSVKLVEVNFVLVFSRTSYLFHYYSKKPLQRQSPAKLNYGLLISYSVYSFAT